MRAKCSNAVTVEQNIQIAFVPLWILVFVGGVVVKKSKFMIQKQSKELFKQHLLNVLEKLPKRVKTTGKRKEIIQSIEFGWKSCLQEVKQIIKELK